MKHFLLSLMLSAVVLTPTIAQQRSEADAAAIANAFMQNNGYNFNITKAPKINKVSTEKAGEITPYYIFNDTQKGGFVIVGGQEGMSDILAYSYDECFDTDDLPPSAQMWLDIYAEVAKKAANDPAAAKAEKKARAKAFLESNFSLRQNVPPLLGDINYGQSSPYNRMCPKLSMVRTDGTEYLGQSIVGCTSTALGTLMRYWKWPKHSTGKKTHTFTYDADSRSAVTVTKEMTLTVDYDSVGEYDWDNMIPTYKNGGYTDEQANAVALLMYHCSVAMQAKYGTGGTGASLRPENVVKHFGYSSDYIGDHFENYTNYDLYKFTLADELSQGRPIWCAGSGTNAAHSYICDGYDLNGLFHFNLGWNGSSNGFYEIAPTPTVPYGNGMYYYRHLHPVGKLTPESPTRRVVVEAGLGDWNTESSKILNAINAVDKSSKYGETIITILTADSQEDAEAHLEGLGQINGILFDRCTELTNNISTTTFTNMYRERFEDDSPAQMDIDAAYSSDTTMQVSVSTLFPKTNTDANRYRMAFVYTEDGININGVSYNNLARGMYPNKNGFENCFPDTVIYDTEYIYTNDIPIPAAIKDITKCNLIVLLIDSETDDIVNANYVELKQVKEWRERQIPAYYDNGKPIGTTATIATYYFDEEESSMPIAIKIKNPLIEETEVEVTMQIQEQAENATFIFDNDANKTTKKYRLVRNDIDSTLIIKLKINDQYVSSTSTAKVTLKYKSNDIAHQTINFNYIKWAEGTNAYTTRINNQLESLVPAAVKDTITTLTVGGRISGKDIVFMRDSLSLVALDLGQARIIESKDLYFGEYNCENDIVGIRMFYGTNLETLILPANTNIINNYAAYQCTKLSKVDLGKQVTNIGSYAFSGCTSLASLTIPASVKEIGRNAFKECPVTCVICEGETPAKLGSKVFDGADLAAATLVVPNEAAIEAYKAQKQWKDFGNIITYDQYLTAIAPVTEEAQVVVKGGKVIVSDDADVAIYTFAGKQVAAGKAGEYALPAGNYIVKIGNKAVKIRL